MPPEKFTARKVHAEQLELAITNATWAPTHGLTQPWFFDVFMGDGLSILSKNLPDIYKSETPAEKFSELKWNKLQQRLSNVNALVIVSMRRDLTGKIKELEEVEAVACAVQNFLLTCAAYGLSAYWSSPSFIYSEAMKKFLELNVTDKCLGLLYVGYPEEMQMHAHRKPLEYVSKWHL